MYCLSYFICIMGMLYYLIYYIEEAIISFLIHILIFHYTIEGSYVYYHCV